MRTAGIRILYGDVVARNHKMLQLAGRFGFNVHLYVNDPRVLRVEAVP